jgi:bifunctional DNA-binding transcriptional regulator/antitoxin component of YhaV-PrlF toxin-antitoxin module
MLSIEQLHKEAISYIDTIPSELRERYEIGVEGFIEYLEVREHIEEATNE